MKGGDGKSNVFPAAMLIVAEAYIWHTDEFSRLQRHFKLSFILHRASTSCSDTSRALYFRSNFHRSTMERGGYIPSALFAVILFVCGVVYQFQRLPLPIPKSAPRNIFSEERAIGM